MSNTSRLEYAPFQHRVNAVYEARLDLLYAKGVLDKMLGFQFSAVYRGCRLHGTERSLYAAGYRKTA